MERIAIIQGIRSLADELKPFTQTISSPSRVWDGKAYVKSESREADPYALAWWHTLTTIADLLYLQETELGKRQVEYLRGKLFGGMGSFADYCIDVNRGGDSAKAANQRLNEKRTNLFRLFG
jgi:hypothetical protein